MQTFVLGRGVDMASSLLWRQSNALRIIRILQFRFCLERFNQVWSMTTALQNKVGQFEQSRIEKQSLSKEAACPRYQHIA